MVQEFGNFSNQKMSATFNNVENTAFGRSQEISKLFSVHFPKFWKFWLTLDSVIFQKNEFENSESIPFVNKLGI